MNTIIKLRFATVLLAVAAFILVLEGCKKADLKADTNKAVDKETMANIKANVASQMLKEGGIPEVFVRNQPVTTQWVDQFGKPVTKQEIQNNNFTSVCNYDLPAYCNLIQYSRVFQCAASGLGGPGYLLQFEFELSWNNNVIAKNTVGNIEIYDPTSNLVQTITLDDPATELFITDIGPDGSSGREIFRVKFISYDYSVDLLPSYFINGTFGTYVVKLSAQFGTDCSTGGPPYSLWTLPVTTYGFTGSSGDDPCERNEKGWFIFNGSGGTGISDKIGIAGYNISGLTTCGYGGSFIQPDLQEVEYNVDGGSFQPMLNSTPSVPVNLSGQPFIRVADYALSNVIPGAPSSKHIIGIRYRNWKYYTFDPTWTPPNSSTGCNSIGDGSSPSTLASTFAYEYFEITL